jgi:mRNA interferase RelE/StbE
MNGYEIFYHPLVLKKDIPQIDKKNRERIKNSIELKLATRPEVFGKPLQHTLQGLWALRVGDWRVIYDICGLEVKILRIGHRREVYEQAIREMD